MPGSCQGVVKELSGGCLGIVRELSGEHQGVGRGLSLGRFKKCQEILEMTGDSGNVRRCHTYDVTEDVTQDVG